MHHLKHSSRTRLSFRVLPRLLVAVPATEKTSLFDRCMLDSARCSSCSAPYSFPLGPSPIRTAKPQQPNTASSCLLNMGCHAQRGLHKWSHFTLAVPTLPGRPPTYAVLQIATCLASSRAGIPSRTAPKTTPAVRNLTSTHCRQLSSIANKPSRNRLSTVQKGKRSLVRVLAARCPFRRKLLGRRPCGLQLLPSL